jgi:hypothetical protein
MYPFVLLTDIIAIIAIALLGVTTLIITFDRE